MRVIVIRHHAEDSPGFIADAFVECGAEVVTRLFPGEGELPALDGLDHAVVLGAIPSVNESGPPSLWIKEELAWLRNVDDAGVPILGICFGAQAMCAAFGGQVEAAPHKEIGWKIVDTTDPALIPAGPWLEFHGDRCLPPPTATILASNDVGVQAFALGRHLAVQFHPEVDGAQLQRWLDGGGRAEVVETGEDPDALLALTVSEEPAAKARAAALVETALRLAKPGHDCCC
jgi:GMP synthase-like glutamine amidotransferase